MAMTRQDFEMLAEIISEYGDKGREALAAALADELRATNSRFNREQFVTACTTDGYRRRR